MAAALETAYLRTVAAEAETIGEPDRRARSCSSG